MNIPDQDNFHKPCDPSVSEMPAQGIFAVMNLYHMLNSALYQNGSHRSKFPKQKLSRAPTQET